MQKTCIYSSLFVLFLSSCNSTQMPDLGEKAETQTLKIYVLNVFHVFLCTMEIKNKLFLLK